MLTLLRWEGGNRVCFKYQWPLDSSNQSMKGYDLAISVKVRDQKEKKDVRKSPTRYRKEDNDEEVAPTTSLQDLPQAKPHHSKASNPSVSKISMHFIAPKPPNSQTSQENLPSRIHSLKSKPKDPTSRISLHNPEFEGFLANKLLRKKKPREKSLRNKINLKVDLPANKADGPLLNSFHHKRFSHNIVDYQSSKDISEQE